MVYTILISIVFIAELIIFFAVMQKLFQADKKILNMDKKLTQNKSCIEDICTLVCKISEQWVILAEEFVDRIKEKSENLLLKQLSKMLITILLINLNFKFIKKIRNSKITKTLAKGFSLLENMV